MDEGRKFSRDAGGGCNGKGRRRGEGEEMRSRLNINIERGSLVFPQGVRGEVEFYGGAACKALNFIILKPSLHSFPGPEIVTTLSRSLRVKLSSGQIQIQYISHRSFFCIIF